MIIRPAVINDSEAIANLRETTLRTVVAATGLYTPAQIDGWASNYGPDRVAAFIVSGHYWVADNGACIIGIGRFEVTSPFTASIRGLFVDAAHVGKGVGSQLIKHLMSEAATLSVNVFDVVATLNARIFYERHGFRTLAFVDHATPNGVTIPAVQMRRT